MNELSVKKVDIETGENEGIVVGANNGVIINGMSYTDIRNLCLDLIRDELSKTKDVALAEAQKRDNELVLKLFTLLSNMGIDESMLQKSFEEPSMQMDFIEAEKSYIKYGTPELCDIISELLVKRIQENEHSLLQIALGEAIKTVGILLPTQIATLSLRFLLCHTRYIFIGNQQAFANYLREKILPIFCSGVSEKSSEFQHLTYTRCGTISISSNSLMNYFLPQYKGLFSNGFAKKDIPVVNDQPLNEQYPSLFIRCVNDSSKLQINALDEETLEYRINELKINAADATKLKNLYNNYTMSPAQAQSKIIEWCPEMEELFNYWESSAIKNLNLSSVGIVIGALYAATKTNEFFDLSIWI